MLAGLQPHHHTPEPQTTLAASPSRWHPTHPNLSAPTFPGASQEVALRGQGGLGSCLRATEFKIRQRIPALSSTGHSDASMDQFWWKLMQKR